MKTSKTHLALAKAGLNSGLVLSFSGLWVHLLAFYVIVIRKTTFLTS